MFILVSGGKSKATVDLLTKTLLILVNPLVDPLASTLNSGDFSWCWNSRSINIWFPVAKSHRNGDVLWCLVRKFPSQCVAQTRRSQVSFSDARSLIRPSRCSRSLSVTWCFVSERSYLSLVWPIAILLEYVWISVSGVFGYCVDMLDLLGFGCCYSCYMCLICLGVRSHTSLIDPDLNLCSVLLVMFQAQLGYYAQSHDPQTFWALATCFQEKSPHWWPVPQRICPSFISWKLSMWTPRSMQTSRWKLTATTPGHWWTKETVAWCHF